ncbi:MAG: hemagglutinin repeat-containing protein [Zoogloea sp.]|nr:hemagglutinin repeat-containing protein [Zoogloea sp.]MDD3354004.1 hemagglutinin repeat-containing protein [Zoogloea sp.]
MLKTANDVLQVNIQTPSAAGVSRNLYRQFDVPAGGAVLNNSRTNTPTQLGGMVQGNPWLATGTARLILNEINSTQPSQLRGYLEVGGNRAEVIVANPAGILCDNCGFINASRATLSTGRPVLLEGQLDGYRVTGGEIHVNGAGMNTHGADYTSLIARAIRLNAGIWAQALHLHTGAADVPADGSTATPIPGNGAPPAFSVDVAALGGMYAGWIRLVGTDAGVGVRNAGHIGASAGEVHITSQGWLENRGQVSASAGVTIDTKGPIHHDGALVSTGPVRLSGEERITLDGHLLAGGDVSIHTRGAQGRISGGRTGWLMAGQSTIDGSSTPNTSLSLSAADQISLHGTLMAGLDLQLSSGTLDLGSGQLAAPHIRLESTQGALTLDSSHIVTQSSFQARTPGHLSTIGARISGPLLEISSDSLNNTGGEMRHTGLTNLALTPAGDLINTRGLIATNSSELRLDAATLDNHDGQIQHAGSGKLVIRTTSLTGNHGQIRTNGLLDLETGRLNLEHAATQAAQLQITATELHHDQGQLIQTGTSNGVIAIQGALDNPAGSILSNGPLQLSTHQLNNQGGEILVTGSHALTARIDTILDNREGGRLQAGGDVTLVASSAANDNGRLLAGQHLSLDRMGNLSNVAGLISGHTGLKIQASSLDNTAGHIESAKGNVGIRSDEINNTQGQIFAAAGLTLDAKRLFNLEGAIYSGRDLQLDFGDTFTNNGLLGAGGNLTLTAQSILGSVSSLFAAGLQTDGMLSGNGKLTLDARGHLAVQGRNLASGQASFEGATLDLAGSQTSASNLLLTARSGQLDAHGAEILATHTLQASAATLLDTHDALFSAAELKLQAHSLDNSDGELLHTGTSRMTLNLSGTLNNTRGRIASNGTLDVASRELDNRAGEIASASGQSLRVDVPGRLDNRQYGQIHAGGNTSVTAGSLDNSTGTLTAGNTLSVTTPDTLSNAAGLIAGNAGVTLQAGNTDNTAGRIESAAGSVFLQSSDLNNQRGQVFAAQDLNVQARQVLNPDGSLYAGQDARLELGGLLAHSGVLGAGRDLSVHAQRIDATAASLFAAGLQTNGQMAGTATLLLDAAGPLVAQGQNLAAGHATLQGSRLDLAGSQTSAHALTLNARSADMDIRGAEIVAATTLQVHAATLLDTRQAYLSASQLNLQAHSIDNTRGELIHTGSGAMSLQLPGHLNNTEGRIASNATTLRLEAGTLTNQAGHIDHAGSSTLEIHTQTLAGSRGQILTNGLLDLNTQQLILDSAKTQATQLNIHADSLQHHQGQLIQTGTGSALIQVSGNLDNRQALIASNGDLTLQTGSLDNRAGKIVTTGIRTLDLHSTGHLDNRDSGQIHASGAANLLLDSLDNAQGSITSGGLLAIGSAGTLNNQEGRITGLHTTRVVANALDNRAGLITSVEGSSVLQVTGQLTNTQGTVAADHALTLLAGSLDNQSGILLASSLEILTSTQGIDNRSGQIIALGTRDEGRLELGGGRLDNERGLLQAQGTLTIDTAGEALINGQTAMSGGIGSATQIALRSGHLDNRSGHISSEGIMDIHAAQLDNSQGGLLASLGNTRIQADSLSNASGRIQSLGDLNTEVSGTLDNGSGLIQTARTGMIHAGTLINTATRGTDQGIEGAQLELTSHRLDNQEGALRASQYLRVGSSSHIDNTRGLISSQGTLSLADISTGSPGLSINNTDGVLIADDTLTLQAHTLEGRGQVLSQQDLDLRLSGNLANHGEIHGNGDSLISVEGTLTNHSRITAVGSLEVRAGNLDNLATGEILAAGTFLTTQGSQINRGLIDGSITRISGASVHNLGTGRIYGDYLAIQAGSLFNLLESGTAPAIAARTRLDLGVGTLTNRDHGLIFSAGDMAIGGGLDANSQASGTAGTITNASATIEALGNLQLAASQINNLDAYFTTRVVRVASSNHREYAYTDSPYRYDQSATRIGYRYNDDDVPYLELTTPYSDGRRTWGESYIDYSFTRHVDEEQILTADPGQILAGGTLQLNGGHLLNDKSRIMAGGALQADMGSLENRSAIGERITTDTGTVTHRWRQKRSGRDRPGSDTQPYLPAPTVQSLTLATPVFASNTGGTGSGAALQTHHAERFSETAENTQTQQITSRSPVLFEVKSTVEDADTIDTTSVASSTGRYITQDTDTITTEATVTSGMVQIDKAHDATAVSPAVSTPPPALFPSIRTSAQAQASPGTQGATQRTTTTGQPLAPSATPPAPGTLETAPQYGVRALSQNFHLPDTRLFIAHPESSAHYLVETDPQFTRQQNWLSSDYMLSALGMDPAQAQKRLGDGFYEQRLVREQVAQLTGRRFLENHTSDEAEYQALMNAGLTHAREWQLQPGIALSAEQMAKLTTDLVWLVETQITLTDGSTQSVLVPQVYARVREGDIDGSGGLISASTTKLASATHLLNTGTITGREQLTLSADTLENRGGRITGDSILAAARTDLINTGGRIDALRSIDLRAGRDLIMASTTRSSTTLQGGRTNLDRLASIHISGGDLTLQAGRDLVLDANQILNTAPTAAGSAGSTQLLAGRHINLGTLTASNQQEITWNTRNYRNENQTQDVGTRIQTSGDIHLQAGQNLQARAAQISTEKGGIEAIAGDSLILSSGQQRTQLDEAHQYRFRGFLSSKTITTQTALERNTSVGTTLSGNSTTLAAGKDIQITGSNVVSTVGTTLAAGQDVNVEASITEQKEARFNMVKESGLMRSGGIGFSLGSRLLSMDNDGIHTTATGSILGSTEGNVQIHAGRDYLQSGSQVLSPSGNIHINAGSIRINESRQSQTQDTQTRFKQSGLTMTLTGGMLDIASNLGNSLTSMMNGENDQNQRLHALNSYAQGAKLWESGKAVQTALQGENGTNDAIAASGIKLSASFSTSRSDGSSHSVKNIASESGMRSQGDIILTARTSDIEIQGSQITADGQIHLDAARDIKLLASQDTESNRSRNTSSGMSLGVSINAGKEQAGVSVDIAGHHGQGKANTESIRHNNTEVSSGTAVYLKSGRDATLSGATLNAPHVLASVGRNLLLESLQDQTTGRASQNTAGFSASIPVYGSAQGSAAIGISRQAGKVDYLSVNEQTGIHAGQGGFHITVQGHTALTGAVITSTAPPEQNTLVTATLNSTDLDNHLAANSRSSGFSLSTDMFQGKYGAIKGVAGNLMNQGSAKRNDHSQTRSGISEGSVVILDEAGQQERTGLSTQETLMHLNRDTSSSHRTLIPVDVAQLDKEARQAQADNMLLFKTITAFTDEAYQRAFLDEAKTYEIEKNKYNDAVISEHNGTPLKKDTMGKIHISNNGIFNTPEDAAKNALQNANGYDGPHYLVYFPQADNMLSELMIAGYMKFLESTTTGLTNATQKNVELMKEYGQDGLETSGHSRGGMTTGNALEALKSEPGSTGVLSGTQINLYGSAYNAQKATHLLQSLSNGKGIVNSQVHIHDFVGTHIGANPPTGGTTKEGWTKLADWLYLFIGKDTAHNCYGNGNRNCSEYWQSTPKKD